MTVPIHHVSLLTRYAEENRFFYTTILGLRFVKKTVNQDNHKMLHYYYGNYAGTPGSVITFFVVPALAKRYDNEHFLSSIGLKIPKGSLPFWEQRLAKAQIAFTKELTSLQFKDRDQVNLRLVEVNQPTLSSNLQVPSSIPGNKQILGLLSTEFHIADPEKTADFFYRLLGLKNENGQIRLNKSDFIQLVSTNTSEKTRMGRGSMDHIAFSIKSENDLDLLYKKAKQQRWQIEKLIHRGYFKSLYIREPGGNRVEFATLTPGFTIDEPLETLGERLILPSFLEKKRTAIEATIYQEK
ncbi:VOC family protein [Enterococcus caccae]|uniref:VOC domain-containing protein n=1 Tax=Enterococcus caccae ATCC BAA-1240 TaxID=1158612 RepID=R3U2S4_9ENTE|nr:VOC family protein [Enterococcus caccae]EOL47688.1 hypothetical protein UC7_00938 [Enterococcus caccae ATCC BAA-1240]EOT65486.1 hypothetical protein I580_01242 [Enterococcus caccae ATCC BAA-1240]OJG27333.1 hypothetical protein RU98_GL002785 [Enterococcus caccae]